jgi:DNA gyrase/topoisomerase IV subunit B
VFKPDPSIFKTTLHFEFDKLAARLDELAYLNAGLVIHLTDKRPKQQQQQQSALPMWGVGSRLGQEGDGDTDFAGESSEDEDDGDMDVDKAKAPSQASRLPASAATAEMAGDETRASAATTTRQVTFKHEGGIRELVQVLCEGKSPLLLAEGGSKTTSPAGVVVGPAGDEGSSAVPRDGAR